MARVVHLPPTGLTTALWKSVPALLLPIDSVVLTQDHLDEELVQYRRTHLTESFIGDPWPHVVVWRGIWYLEDGHHRHAAHVANGDRYFMARVFVYPKEEWEMQPHVGCTPPEPQV